MGMSSEWQDKEIQREEFERDKKDDMQEEQNEAELEDYLARTQQDRV